MVAMKDAYPSAELHLSYCASISHSQLPLPQAVRTGSVDQHGTRQSRPELQKGEGPEGQSGRGGVQSCRHASRACVVAAAAAAGRPVGELRVRAESCFPARRFCAARACPLTSPTAGRRLFAARSARNSRRASALVRRRLRTARKASDVTSRAEPSAGPR